MYIYVALLAALVTRTSEVSGQCISSNDALPPLVRPDMSHVSPFSIDLFQELLPSKGNFIFSPHSIWSALVLAYFGAGGNTRSQLQEALRLSNKEEALALYRGIDQMYGGVRRGLRAAGKKYGSRMRGGVECGNPGNGRQSGRQGGNGTRRMGRRCRKQRVERGNRKRRPRAGDRMEKIKSRVRGQDSRRREARRPRTEQRSANYTIRSANRVYVQEGFPLRRCLRRSLARELRVIDFKKSKVASDAINKFVSGATRGKIQQLVDPPSLSGVQMALVNAVYFKGLWEKQFDPKSTRKTPFITAPDSRQLTTVEMMRVKASFKTGWSRSLDADVLEMPYKGGGASMFVILPRRRERQSLDQMIGRLTDTVLHTALRNLTAGDVVVALPKFKLETTIEEELSLGLQNLGIRDLFSPQADLSAFSAEERLFLNKGIHKAVVEVNEEGAEAAAATAFLFFRSSRGSSFVCNRPFLFLIRDNTADNILFIGVFRSP